jgi:DNA ligase (NAD+)
MEQENKVDEEKIISLVKKEQKSYEKNSKKLDEPKKKKLIIKESIPEPESISILPKQPIIEKTNKSLQEIPRYNETFIEILDRLAKLMSQKGDQIRSRAYTKAGDTIRNITEDITNVSQLEGKPNIGPTIRDKFTEYLESGTLQLFEREKDKPEYIFSEIYGIGPKKAKDIVEKGITTIVQLREHQDELLNDVQKTGLKYYEDILERIPRSEIDEYNLLFKSTFDKIASPCSKYEIVGSYRRGAHTSGDIDAIITSDDATMFPNFIDTLLDKQVIIEVLSRGKTKCLVIAKLPNHKTVRRVDFMYTSQEEYPFAILYFTGSKTFNTVMRGHALKMGLSLNEHGLHKKQPGKEKEEKVDQKFSIEKDIFDYLKMEYKEPEERIDGRSVIIKNGSIIPIAKPIFIQNTTAKKIKEPKLEKEAKTRKIREPKPPKEPKPINAPKRTYKKRVKKEGISGSIKNSLKKNSSLTQKPEKEVPKVILIPPISEPEEIPIIPVIPMETTTAAKIEIKTKKNKELKQNKTKKQSIKIDIETNNEKPLKNRKMSNKIEGKKHIKLFKERGISIIESLSEQQITDIIVLANDAYYNTKNPIMTDNEYDIVREYAERKYPENETIKHVGAPIEKNKVTLPYNMPSMDKIKPDTGALLNWMGKYKGPYVLSCKLDGVSGMYTTEGEEPKLYTRGDGFVGQDITHILRVLKLPVNDKKLVVRGEFILPKKIFDEKYSAKFANPRNLVSGIINSKTLDDKTKDLRFVAYEIIEPLMKPSEQLTLLKSIGYDVVQNKTEDELSNEKLSDLLIDWRTNYEYEIDGVIVTDDNMHNRKDGNPEYAFAFKMVISDQMAEVKVVDVQWNASKSGYLKPRVKIEPIKLGGVTIEFATGFNAAFIEKNKIGVGAVIQIIRSGDVIPHIKSVTTPAEHAKMPDVKYHWTDTHVDIILDDVGEDMGVRDKEITAFFTGLSVDGLSSGNVKRIMTAGYDSIPKIIKMTKNDFEKVEGFKTKMIEKVYTSLHEKIEKASLLEIMAVSNKFGRGIGERKIRPILDEFPDILTRKESSEQKIAMLKSIKGIGKENANVFVEHIDDFLTFLKECGLEGKLTVVPPIENKIIESFDKDHVLYEKHIVMTKVRDKTIIEGLSKVGGILDDSIGKNTFVLVVKSKDDNSNKTKYATDHNIPIMTPEEFIKQYLN